MKRPMAFLFVLVLCLCAPAFAAAATAPSIEYGTPEVRNHEATLHFSIDPGGLETMYEVDWAPAGEELSHWNMPRSVPAGEQPVALSVTLPRYWEGGLLSGHEYHWRVRAWNAEDETVGSESFFTTTDVPRPKFVSATATQTGPSSVAFTGTVDPEGTLLTGCRFRWVTASVFHNAGFEKWAAVEMVRFGETVPCEESFSAIGSGTEAVTVHAEASGLEPGEYFFRLEGENAYESSAAGGVPFTVSLPYPPAVGPAVSPVVNPPGLESAPGLQIVPGLTQTPGLHKTRRKKATRFRHNATIAAPLARRK